MSVKTLPCGKLLCFEVSTVSTWGRPISLSPLLSAARLSACSLLAGFWFRSSLLNPAFRWLCYCLLPLGLLPQYHIPLAGWLHSRLLDWPTLSARVCASVSQQEVRQECVKSSGRGRCVCACAWLLVCVKVRIKSAALLRLGDFLLFGKFKKRTEKEGERMQKTH